MAGRGTQWYENAVIYATDVEVFQDSDGDGVGDFQGLIDRLDYLNHLGVNCLWLLPFYPSPNRDNGYDVMDYYGVDPRHGTLGDFVDFVEEAQERGIHVLIDLVVNHTSNEHPWFEQAREGHEKYRDYYVWSEDPPDPDPSRGQVFPGEVDVNRVWSWDDEAGAYYYHRFYPFQPDLNLANPDVREEIRKIMQFWLRLGVSGFRIDAAGLMVQEKRPEKQGSDADDSYDVLREIRSYATRGHGDVVLMAEADVEVHNLPGFCTEGKMDLLLNFVLNAHLFLALATEQSDALEDLFAVLPALPEGGQWANFLRNYDELNLGSLSAADKEVVFDQFAPTADMRIYNRGIRRRLAPILDGDQERVELAFSLLFSLPGTPLLVYGDEIGMGEDLSLPGRTAVRTPMQWSPAENAGFSTAPSEDLVRPIITDGSFSYDRINVADQWAAEGSLLNFMEHLIGTRHETPEIGAGEMTVLETEPPSVFAHRFDDTGSVVVMAHNLASEPATIVLDLDHEAGTLLDLLGSGEIKQHPDGRCELSLDRYGYRWLRVEQHS